MNQYGQPVGPDLGGWTPPPRPPRRALAGRHVRIEPLDPDRHAVLLFETYASAPDSLWTYLPFGPFDAADDLCTVLEHLAARPDWQLYVIEVGGRCRGFFAYLRISPAEGSIEIGSIVLSARAAAHRRRHRSPAPDDAPGLRARVPTL